MRQIRGCPSLSLHVVARADKGDPYIFVAGVVINNAWALQLWVHTYDGVEPFQFLPLAPLLDWVCMWSGGLLIRSLTPAQESTPVIVVASRPSLGCYNHLIKEDLGTLSRLFTGLSVTRETGSSGALMARRVARLGASGRGPFLSPVQRFSICVSNDGDVSGHISDHSGQLERDARMGAAWGVLSTPSSAPTACGCHPDWSLRSHCTRRQRGPLLIHQFFL